MLIQRLPGMRRVGLRAARTCPFLDQEAEVPPPVCPPDTSASTLLGVLPVFQGVSQCLLCWGSQGSVCRPDLSLGNRTSLLHATDKAWILQPEVRTRTQLSHSTAARSRSPSSPALQPEASRHEKALLPVDLAPTPGTSCPLEPRPHALARCF